MTFFNVIMYLLKKILDVMRKIELLAPAGDINKLNTAIHFGADAVYCAVKNFGLRAGSKNFTDLEMEQAVNFVHSLNKKIYVTMNIYANNADFSELKETVLFLKKINVDAVIVSDPGVIYFIKNMVADLPIHLSTQANSTNKYAAKFWYEQGIDRVVLAREMHINDIKEIRDFVPELELETFVHGAMCIAYSGRCLLSNYLTSRNGNRGECVQACRWAWEIHEKNHNDKKLTLTEDNRGTYIMNSRDLNMIKYLDQLEQAGINSFKIEGRMKTQYYVGCVVNAYRMAMNYLEQNKSLEKMPEYISDELVKISHRDYTTGFFFGNDDTINIASSQTKCDYDFMAEVIDYNQDEGVLIVQQRNRFRKGDTLEILSSNSEYLNCELKINEMYNETGELIDDAKLVQQVIYIPCKYKLKKSDILRKKVQNE